MHHTRKAFSILTSIVVIVLMASIAVLTTSMSGKIVKETTTQYQREQAVLLANSYTEYAILAVTANNRATTCLSTINGTWNGYSANIQIAYIGIDDTSNIGNCAGTRKLGIVPATSIQTPLTIIVDAYINYKDLDNSAAPDFVYHRRTVQKI